MKKILFVASVQRHITAFHIPFIKYFQLKGYEVHVASKLDRDINKENKALDGIVWKNIEFSRNPINRSNISAYKELVNYMKLEHFDAVHTHTPVASFLSRMAAKRAKIKYVIYTAHGFHFYKGAPLKNWIIYYNIEKIASRWTDAIITMNNEDYNIAIKKFKNNKTNIFYVNGVGVDIDKYKTIEVKNITFKESLGLNKDDFVISVIAELSERKNQIQLLEAMTKISNKYKNIKVLLVGNGPMTDKIKKYLREHNLEDSIILLGRRTDIPQILNITDICCLFSKQEGLPRNLMEAMCNKKAIICSKIRGNTELVIDGENGIVVDVGDIDSTVKSIEKIYLDKDLRTYMGKNGFEKIQKFSQENILNQMDKVYSSILDDI